MNIVTTTFHGAELYGFERADGVYVALKPIVTALGLNWSGQLQRVKRDPILAEGMCIMPTPFGDGGEQDAACLRLDLLNGWLFGVSVRAIKDPNRRAAVLTYQRECHRVLAQAFAKPSRPTIEAMPAAPADNVGQDSARKLVTETRHLFGELAGRQLWFKLGLPTVPAMYAAPAQIPLFTYDAHPNRGGQA